MMQTECRLMQDLLPLYGEKLVSPETARAIEEHLSSCPACAQAWHLFQKPVPDPLLSREEEPAPGLAERLAIRVKKTVIAVVLLLLVGGAGLAYATFNLGKNLGMDDPSYRLAEELGLFTPIKQVQKIGGTQVTLEKGLFDSSRTILFFSFSSPSKDSPQINLTDEEGQEYLMKSGKGFKNKYFVIEFEPLHLATDQARVSLALQPGGEVTEFLFPVDVTKTAQLTRIIYPNQSKKIGPIKVALEKAVLGVSESQFRLQLDWPIDGSVAGIALGRGLAYFPTSVVKIPAGSPPPPGPGPLPPGGVMSNYAATYGVNYRSADPPVNRPALYDLTTRQEVSAGGAEYRTTQFPSQVVATLNFGPVNLATDQLELLLPPLYLYTKALEQGKIPLNLEEQEITINKAIPYQGGEVFVEKAWTDNKSLSISYKIKSRDGSSQDLPYFSLAAKGGLPLGKPRFDRQKEDVVLFSLGEEHNKEVVLTLESVGKLLPREKFTLEMK